MLTHKQQAYVDARARGLGPSAAYREAYDASKMSAPTVATTAAELESHPKIAPILAGIQKQALAAVGITAEMITQRAWEIAQEDKGDRTAALALLAKRHREFSDKHEVTGDLNLRVQALAAVANMTPEQLRELAGGARG